MGILITSASKNVTLSKLRTYVIASQSSTPSYDIPGKEAATTDTDATVNKPTSYRLSAEISDGEKWVMEIMRGERQSAFTLKDNESPIRNVTLDNIEFSANVGKLATDMDKWVVDLTLTGTDH
jgi:hypothetical protein